MGGEVYLVNEVRYLYDIKINIETAVNRSLGIAADWYVKCI